MTLWEMTKRLVVGFKDSIKMMLIKKPGQDWKQFSIQFVKGFLLMFVWMIPLTFMSVLIPMILISWVAKSYKGTSI